MAETLFVLCIWALISVFKRLFCEEYSKYSLHINIALMLLHCEEGCEINFTMQVWASEFILFNPGCLKHSLYAALFQSLKSPLKLWRRAFSNLRCYGKKRTPKRKGECGGINLCFGYVLLGAYHCLPFFFFVIFWFLLWLFWVSFFLIVWDISIVWDMFTVYYLCSFIHIKPFIPHIKSNTQLWVEKGNCIPKVPEIKQLNNWWSCFVRVQFHALTFAPDLGRTTQIHVDICMYVSTHMLFN